MILVSEWVPDLDIYARVQPWHRPSLLVQPWHLSEEGIQPLCGAPIDPDKFAWIALSEADRWATSICLDCLERLT